MKQEAGAFAYFKRTGFATQRSQRGKRQLAMLRKQYEAKR
jgi:hypothetical protein